MARKNSILYAIPISAILLLEVGMPARLSSIATAAPENTNNQVVRGSWNEFEPPGNGAPGRREPGGTRGPSNSKEIGLTALMPEKNTSLTVSQYPSFLFYVPEMNPQTTVEFVMYEYVNDGTDKEVYKTLFKTTGKPGIISLNLPDKANFKPLEIGKNYRWYFSVIVNPSDRAADQVVEGWVKRVAKNANLENELKTASGLAVAKAYRETGVWQDTIATLADLRRDNPSDMAIAKEWNEVLKSVELEKIAQAPIMDKIAIEK